MNELHVYDFDGTLFNSPTDTLENRKKYEELTGIPWVITQEKSFELSKKHGKKIKSRSGWWGQPETLEPPLVPDPAPLEQFNKFVVDSLNLSKKNEQAITLILTGRHVNLRKQVERICNDGNLLDDRVKLYCMGEDGPKPQSSRPSKTLPWKLWVVEQYLNSYPSIEKTIFWEDRIEHVQQMQQLDSSFYRSVVVNFIQGLPTPDSFA